MKNQISAVAKRHKLFLHCVEYFTRLAAKYYAQGKDPNTYTLLCINVDDPWWTGLAEDLMPDENWQPYRDRGELPLARGAVTSDINAFIAEVCPDVAPLLTRKLAPHQVRIAILSFGVSIYQIDVLPQPDQQEKLAH